MVRMPRACFGRAPAAISFFLAIGTTVQLVGDGYSADPYWMNLLTCRFRARLKEG